MARRRRIGTSATGTFKTDAWKLEICKAVGMPYSACFEEGFRRKFEMIVNSGKIKSKTLEEILRLSEEEIKVLEHRNQVLRKALAGTLSDELREAVKKQSKEEAIAEVIGDPQIWKKALPERDRDGVFYENWENASELIEKSSGCKVSVLDLQKYVKVKLEAGTS